MNKRMVQVLVVLVVLTALCAGVASAEGLAGKWELSTAAAWAKASDLSLTAAYVKPGYFFTPNLEAELATIYIGGGDDDSSVHAMILAPAVVWNFTPKDKVSTAVPYVGAGFYFASARSGGKTYDTNGFQWMAGGKFFLKGDTSDPQLAAFVEFRQVNGVDYGTKSLNVNTVLFGFSNYF